MLTARRAYHPLVPAVSLAVVAGAGLAAATAVDLGSAMRGPAVAAAWTLVGLASGYALSGSV